MIGKALLSDRLTAWHVVAATALAALGVAVTWDAWCDIAMFARGDEEASHIFLVPFVALWMVMVRRMRFRHCRPTGTIIGPLMVACGWVMASYGFNHSTTALWHLGSLIVVLGCIFSVLGKHVLFRFFPAVAVLAFMVPIPGQIRQQIALPLQNWTARIASTLLDIMGVPTELSGNQLSINHQRVMIIEACNGMRMVFPLLLIAYAFSFGLPLKMSVRLLILAASPVTAIVCNVIRTLPLIWLYGYGSAAVAQTFHDYSGWLMLPIAFVLLMGIIKLLRWAMLPVTRYTLAAQ